MLKKRRSVHRVKAFLQVTNLSKAGAGLSLEIFHDEEKLGTIEIGRGSFTWFAKNAKRGSRRSWARFSNWMEGQ